MGQGESLAMSVCVCVWGGGGVRSGGEAGVGVWEGNLWEHL